MVEGYCTETTAPRIGLAAQQATKAASGGRMERAQVGGQPHRPTRTVHRTDRRADWEHDVVVHLDNRRRRSKPRRGDQSTKAMGNRGIATGGYCCVDSIKTQWEA